jgi:hypothetical protein
MDATAQNMKLRERRRGRDLLLYCSGTGAGTLSDGASDLAAAFPSMNGHRQLDTSRPKTANRRHRAAAC